MSTLKPLIMQLKDLPISSLTPEIAIDRNPLTVAPETDLVDVLALMLNGRTSCSFPKANSSSHAKSTEKVRSGCAIALENNRLVGVLTEWDLVNFAAQKIDLKGLKVADVMTQNFQTLRESELRDIFSLLKLFREHKIRHLPILNQRDRLVGIVSLDSIRKVLKPAELLKRRRVVEVMQSKVIRAECTASVLDIARLMAEYRVSSVVITEDRENNSGVPQEKLNLDNSLLNIQECRVTHHLSAVSPSQSLVPVGILTERDLLHFLALGLDLQQVSVQSVMSAPLYYLNARESVWTAHQQMQRQKVKRLVICGDRGELIGIVTQSSLMGTLDPTELYGIIQGLEQKVWKLQAEKVELLHNRNVELEKEVNLRTAKLQEQASRERLLAKTALRIRESLNLEEILNTTVGQVRQLLQTDRVIIYRFYPDWSGIVVVESVRDKKFSILGRTIKDPCFQTSWVEAYQKGRTQAVTDIYTAKLTPCHVDFLAEFQVRANLVVPILQGEKLWGLLIAQHCVRSRKWKQSEIDFLQKLATQVAIAIKQSTLFEQAQRELERATRAEAALQKAKDELEIKVQERTTELKAANEQLHRQILERQQAEAELLSSQRFIQRIAETTPNILYIYDLTQQRDVYVNRCIADILGYTSEQIPEMRSTIFEELLHPDDFKRVKEHLQQRIQLDEDEILEIEYRMKDVKGEWHWFISRDTVFSRNADGIPTQILGTASEITSRKRAEEELQQANTKLTNWVNELEKRNQEMDLLGQMNEFLQACLSVEEAYDTLSTLLEPLFSGTTGAVYMISDSKNLLEVVATWGSCVPKQTMFSPHECWALRRGRLHWVAEKNSGLSCKHIHPTEKFAESLCVQMIAQGETLGVLYLASEESGVLTPAKRQLARTVSEDVSLALANLKLRETLHNQSIRDPLTGLYNRRYLEEFLDREIYRASRTKRSLAIVMIDIDHFKHFNDTFGHDAGDAVLRELAEFLQTSIRSSDIACRYGGEELTLILPEVSLENASRRAEQLRQGVKCLNIEHRCQFLGAISISVGVACFPEHGWKSDDLIQAADAALYRAKDGGRDRVVVASLI